MSEIIELKIVIVGSSRVGKTSILNRYLNNTFQENFLSTILPSLISLSKVSEKFSFKIIQTALSMYSDLYKMI